MSMSASFPMSDILTADEEQELYQHVGSQDMAGLFSEDLNGPYSNDIYAHEQNLHEETTLSMDDFKTFFPVTQLVPLSLNDVLSNEEYPGPHDFEVTVLPNYKSKNPWVYSPPLNKVYMDMNQHFPVDFKIKNRPDKPLYIRTTPQYCAQQHALEPVSRCIQHDFQQDPTNKDVADHVRQHVIRCTNKFSQYLGSKVDNQRLSIMFPFSMPQVGVDSVREMFFFVCKSSCSTPGMNRRGIEVIFTLEDDSGNVYGRKCLNVRICACPKRDKEKDENELKKEKPNSVPRGKKRKAEVPPPNPGKVLTQPTDELREYILPQLKVTGKHNVLKLLTFLDDLNSAEIFRYQGTSFERSFKNNLNEVQEIRNSLLQQQQQQ